MSKKVSFGVVFQSYGTQTIDLPDSVAAKNEEAIKEYVESIFPELPLPEANYIPESDEIDWEQFEVEEK